MRSALTFAAPLVAALAATVLCPTTAQANPGVEGTRNLSMGAARASSFGTNAALINPSNMGFSQTFALEPIYQLGIRDRRHGIGFVVMDSLNNPRVSVGLGYLVMRASPTIAYTPLSDDPVRDPGEDTTPITNDLDLVHVSHETFAALGITVVRGWLAIGLKPKYQFSSLRYRDEDGGAHNAHERLNTFGLDTSITANLAGWAAVSVMANNVVGNHPPPYSDERMINLDGLNAQEGSIDPGTLAELSDFPFTVEHGLAVFPLHHPDFSLNFDGVYDFSTYRFEDHVRMQFGGAAEFVLGPVPLRFGTQWDARGKGNADDRLFISGGIGYAKPAKVGGVGVDLGFGFRQQVTGPELGGSRETIIGLNLGLRLRPDL